MEAHTGNQVGSFDGRTQVAAEKQAPAPVSLQAETGMFVLCDVKQVEQGWVRPGAARGLWALDITGPAAAHHARQHGGGKEIELADGAFRLLLPNEQTASYHKSLIEKVSGGAMVASCRVHNMAASAEQIRDALRAKSAGLTTNGAVLALHAPQGVLVEELTDSTGKVVGFTVRAR